MIFVVDIQNTADQTDIRRAEIEAVSRGAAGKLALMPGFKLLGAWLKPNPKKTRQRGLARRAPGGVGLGPWPPTFNKKGKNGRVSCKKVGRTSN